MFERCDASTQQVIETAIAEARRLDHRYLGTEHLLLAIARHREMLPDVGELLPDAEVLEQRIVDAIGPASPPDTELLRTIGVDLGDVRSALRQTFGDDVLDRLDRRMVRKRSRLRSSRRCKSILAGTMGIAPRAKQSFERARDHARRRGRELIDPTALLLGMLDIEDAMSNRMLRELGRDPDELRIALWRPR